MKKFRLGMIMAVFAFIAMLPLRVSAEEIEETKEKEVGVTCTPTNDNKEYSMELYIPNAAKEEIATLSLKLEVDVDPTVSGNDFNDPVVEFSKDVTSKAKVYEYRYQSSLNIYIAGIEALFNEDDTLNIGTVSLQTVSGESVALSGVRLTDDEDAIMVVRGWGDAEAVSRENWQDGTEDPGPDTPPDPDAKVDTEFSVSDGSGVTVSEKSEKVIKKSALAYLQEYYGDKLAELGNDYKVVSRLNLTNVSESDIEQAVKDAFSAVLNGKKIGQYYDISITADVIKDGEVVLGLGNIEIPQLQEQIDLTMRIPEAVRKSGRTYQMLHCRADLMAEALATSKGEDNTVTFSTDSFSPFALAYADGSGANGGGSNGSTNASGTARSAKTGDEANMMLYLILGMASVLGVLATKKYRTE